MVPDAAAFLSSLTARERKLISRLKTPAKIQEFLDGLYYPGGWRYRCPLRVMRDRQARCYDGAVFGAAALRLIGRPPLLVDLFAENDDDHVLAVYRMDGFWGAIAKSNCVGLRYREPVYRSLRELAMSYFDVYFNILRQKTLRSYTVPLHLKAFDKLNWMTKDMAMDAIADRLDSMPRVPLITPRMASKLSLMDPLSFRAGLLGANMRGLYKPPK